MSLPYDKTVPPVRIRTGGIFNSVVKGTGRRGADCAGGVFDVKVTPAYFLINLLSREVSSRARAIFRRSGMIKGTTHMLSTDATLMAPLVWV